MPCCRCNGSGRCRECSCKKERKICTNCLPSRLNRCENLRDRVGQDSLNTSPLDESRTKTQLESEIAPKHRAADPTSVSDNQSLPLHDSAVSLLDYKECHSPSFVWVRHDGDAFCQINDNTYKEVIH